MPAAPAATASHATRPTGWSRHLGLAAFWFGSYFLVAPVYTILLQVEVSQTVVRDLQNSATGLATGLGGAFALVLPPIVGHWSDGLRTRWGRRRPVMVAGALGMAAAMVVMYFAGSYPAVVVGFVLAVAATNVAGAAYVALIPDTVAEAETGRASGLLGFMVQAGTVASFVVLLLTSRAHQIRLTFWVIVLVVLLTLIPSLWAAGTGGGGERVRHRSLAQFLAPLWSGDFGWAVFTRLLFVSGLYTTLPFLVFAGRDFFHVANPAQFTTTFQLVVTAVAIPFSLVFGWLSDRWGRKRFCYLAGAIQAGVLLVFLTGTLSANAILALGAVFGVGYGMFGAVDWALGLDTLPDRARAAKDLGLFHVADALPRVLVPVPIGLMLDAVNRVYPTAGYRAMFAIAAVLYVSGAALVTRIRSVR